MSRQAERSPRNTNLASQGVKYVIPLAMVVLAACATPSPPASVSSPPVPNPVDIRPPAVDQVDRACAEYAAARRPGKGDPSVTAAGDDFCDNTKRYRSPNPDADARWVRGLAHDLSR